MKERSATSDLCAKAKMRIEALFVDASTETGEGLPAQVLSDIYAVINGGHKTFRYMLFTGLLAAVTDRKLHPRKMAVTTVQYTGVMALRRVLLFSSLL